MLAVAALARGLLAAAARGPPGRTEPGLLLKRLDLRVVLGLNFLLVQVHIMLAAAAAAAVLIQVLITLAAQVVQAAAELADQL